jgi:hypothetical protein
VNFKRFFLLEEKVKNSPWQQFKIPLVTLVLFSPVFIISVAILDFGIPAIIENFPANYHKCSITETIINPIGKDTTIETPCPKYEGKLP